MNESHSVTSISLQPNGLYSQWNSPGQNTGVGSLSLLQGIFPTQGYNTGLPHCQQILYQLSHLGSPRILEWVAYPFFSRSSWPRNRPGFPAWQIDSLRTEWELTCNIREPGHILRHVELLYSMWTMARKVVFFFFEKILGFLMENETDWGYKSMKTK